MIVTHNVTIDLQDKGAVPQIDATQDDQYTRDLAIRLMEGDSAWHVPEDAAVVIRYCKSDGVGGEYDTMPDGSAAWSAEGNVLRLALAPQVLTCPGTVMLSATMIREAEVLSIFFVAVSVRPRVQGIFEESETYYNVSGFLPGPVMAEKGQYLRIARVDSRGRVVAVEGADAPAGGAVSTGEPAEDDIPKVFIDGTIPTTKDDVLAEMRYVSKTDCFSAYLKIKAQGNSSLVYAKKNFTIKMYSDEAREIKQKRTFKDWGTESNKYVLKANYIDHSHARNIISARLWNEAVCSRPDYGTLPLEMRNSPRNGAVDGFPVKLYTNGTYQGIYTWNIGKDDWMWGMDEDNASHALLCGEINTDGVYAETACNFRAAWEGNCAGNWEVEVGEKSDAVVSSMNALISCVKDTDDDTFKNTIGNHLDLQSAIDYWIHQYIICGIDGLAKNMLLATYDGVKWICGAYDMDSTFGLWWDGSKFVAHNFKCPEDYQEKYSLLWERISSVYSEEIKARYIELRKTVYSYSNIVTHFERFADTVGKDLYDEDLEIHPGIPFGTISHIKQIRDYIRDRLTYVDGKIIDEKVEYLYELSEPVTLNGTDSFVDTGVKLFDTEKDFTIYIDCDLNNTTTSSEQILLSGGDATTASAQNLTVLSGASDNFMIVRANGARSTDIEDAVTGYWGHHWENLKALVLVYKNGVFSFGRYLISGRATPNSITGKSGREYIYEQNDRTLTIGAKVSAWDNNPSDFITGTLNAVRVYDYALSEEEADAVVVSVR